MPEEVFTLWLDGRILAKGWPPAGIEWKGFLLEHSISFWQQLEWTKQEVYLTWATLGSQSRPIINFLLDAHINDRPNLVTAYVSDSKQRFQYSMKYALEHGTVPETLVLLKEGTRYDVVDGNHRVAALLALQSSQSTKERVTLPQQAWVGTYNNTEQPVPPYGTQGAAGDP